MRPHTAAAVAVARSVCQYTIGHAPCPEVSAADGCMDSWISVEHGGWIAAWRGCEREGSEPPELRKQKLRKWEPALAAEGFVGCLLFGLPMGKEQQARQENYDPGAASLWNRGPEKCSQPGRTLATRIWGAHA